MIRILPPYWSFEELQEIMGYFLGIGRFRAATTVLKDCLDAMIYPKKVILTQSGSSALLIILRHLNYGEGSRVLVPSFVCRRLVGAIQAAGLKPKYVEVNGDLTMDVNDLERKIDQTCKVIVMPHLYGKVCNVGAIQKIAKKYALTLIDDAAAAFLPGMEAATLGMMGDYGIFSFNYKTIASLMGGGIICNRDKEASLNPLVEGSSHLLRKVLLKQICQRIGHRISIALLPKSIQVRLGKEINTTDIKIVPENIHPLSCAIATIQLGKLPIIMKRLNDNVRVLGEHLGGYSDISVVTSPFGDCHTRCVIKINREVPRGSQTNREPWNVAEDFRSYLLRKGVQTFPGYTPCHLRFQTGEYLPKTEAFWRKYLVVPNSPLYGAKDMMYIANVINKYQFSN